MDEIGVNEYGEIVPYSNFMLMKFVDASDISGRSEWAYLYYNSTYQYYIILLDEYADISPNDTSRFDGLGEIIKCGILGDSKKISKKSYYFVYPIHCDWF